MSYWRISDPKERARAKAAFEKRVAARGHTRSNRFFYSWKTDAEYALCLLWRNTGVPQLTSVRTTIQGRTITITTPGGWSIEIDRHECSPVARAIHAHLVDVLTQENKQKEKNDNPQ